MLVWKNGGSSCGGDGCEFLCVSEVQCQGFGLCVYWVMEECVSVRGICCGILVSSEHQSRAVLLLMMDVLSTACTERMGCVWAGGVASERIV